jgi:hypothetical protein
MPDLSQMTERQSAPSALLSDINLNLVREPHRHASVCGIDISQFKGCTL